jgi:hypothetical protein
MGTTQILTWAGIAALVALVLGLNWYRLKDALSMYRNRKR